MPENDEKHLVRKQMKQSVPDDYQSTNDACLRDAFWCLGYDFLLLRCRSARDNHFTFARSRVSAAYDWLTESLCDKSMRIIHGWLKYSNSALFSEKIVNVDLIDAKFKCCESADAIERSARVVFESMQTVKQEKTWNKMKLEIDCKKMLFYSILRLFRGVAVTMAWMGTLFVSGCFCLVL